MLRHPKHVTPVARPQTRGHPWQVVQAASEDGKVKIKWGFDSSEAEVTGEELRAKAGIETETETKD